MIGSLSTLTLLPFLSVRGQLIYPSSFTDGSFFHLEGRGGCVADTVPFYTRSPAFCQYEEELISILQILQMVPSSTLKDAAVMWFNSSRKGYVVGAVHCSPSFWRHVEDPLSIRTCARNKTIDLHRAASLTLNPNVLSSPHSSIWLTFPLCLLH